MATRFATKIAEYLLTPKGQERFLLAYQDEWDCWAQEYADMDDSPEDRALSREQLKAQSVFWAVRKAAHDVFPEIEDDDLSEIFPIHESQYHSMHKFAVTRGKNVEKLAYKIDGLAYVKRVLPPEYH